MNALALVVAFQLSAGITDHVDVDGRVVGGIAGATVGAAVGGVGAALAFEAWVTASAKASRCDECEGYGLMSFFYTVPVALIGAGLVGAGGALLGIVIGDAVDAE
jgi:hypothetical protein